MMKKRHSPDEIAAKLLQADAWSAQGKLHGDIAKGLGVSLMTYHRWRKARPEPADRAPPPATGRKAAALLAAPAAVLAAPADQAAYIADLRLENSRLRRLVTDLLLEKVQLEEVLQEGAPRRRRT
ncbi:MAG: transposase [Xanthobacteraceae bacterium]